MNPVKTLYLIPKAGNRVLDPVSGQPLPAKGASVQLAGSSALYWHRRLRDGDVVAGEPPATPSAGEAATAEVTAEPAAAPEPDHSASTSSATGRSGRSKSR